MTIIEVYSVGVTWEYKVVHYKEFIVTEKDIQQLEEWLNKLGEEGWNLITVFTNGTYVFKRSKR